MKSYSQRRSKLQEKRAARDVGGRAQKGSGSSEFAKGDFRRVGNVRGECKHTVKKTYILKEEELKKIQMEALRGGFEDWVMQVEFVRALGQSTKFAVVDCKMFMEMWVAARPSNYTSLSSSSVCQIGKSFQFKTDDMLDISGLHVMQLAFVEDKEALPPPKMYLIVPWQAYLDVRERYREVQDS